MKKGVLRIFAKFTGKHLCQSLFFNKVAGLRPQATLLKKRLWHRCFPVNFAKILRTPFLLNTSGRRLLRGQITLFYFVRRNISLTPKPEKTYVIKINYQDLVREAVLRRCSVKKLLLKISQY